MFLHIFLYTTLLYEVVFKTEIYVTVVSLDSATGKVLPTFESSFCTSFCDRALPPHQMLKKCIQAVEAWPYMY